MKFMTHRKTGNRENALRIEDEVNIERSVDFKRVAWPADEIRSAAEDADSTFWQPAL